MPLEQSEKFFPGKRAFMSLLKVEELSVGFRNNRELVEIIDKVSFEIGRGEILALVGESGCGKSAACLSLTRLNAGSAVVSGKGVLFETREGKQVDLLEVSPKEMRKIRGKEIAYIFQEPLSSLNPVFRIGDQIAEVLELHRRDVKDSCAEIVRLLGAVGIPDPEARMMNFPHELSGGMQQRVMIAMALAGDPSLIIADEPTTALDVTVQAQIIELLGRVNRNRGVGILFISHDLNVVRKLCKRVAVMYKGVIVETGETEQIFNNPQHEYTKKLIAAIPKREKRKD